MSAGSQKMYLISPDAIAPILGFRQRAAERIDQLEVIGMETTRGVDVPVDERAQSFALRGSKLVSGALRVCRRCRRGHARTIHRMTARDSMGSRSADVS